jgi:ADP-ribose pyrophosphatase
MSSLPKHPNPYLKKTSQIVYEGENKRMFLDELELNGKSVKYSYLDKAGGTCIIAMNKEGKVALVGQWRYPLDQYSWEFPAGGMEEGESVLDTAKRELLEEAGVEAQEWINLGSMFPNASNCKMESHAYLARDLKIGDAKPDPDEDLQLLWLPWPEVIKAAQQGEIKEALSIFAIFKAQGHLRNEE